MSECETSAELFSSNKLISSTLASQQIFALGRLGSVEAQIVGAMENNFDITLRARKLAWMNAGIAYPSNSQLKSFADVYCQSLVDMDLIAKWPDRNISNQDNLIAKYGRSSIKLVSLRILDPVQSFLSGIPEEVLWTQMLEDKNVLVVSQFAQTISKQFSQRKYLHQGDILPAFNLQTITPPSTNGATFLKGSYTRNLEKFRNQLSNHTKHNHVDIALVSAGAYGLPTVAFLKSIGVSAIYMGGSLQLLFGIMGNRWREIDLVRSAVTPTWVMAPKENRPFGYRLIEDGSYW